VYDTEENLTLIFCSVFFLGGGGGGDGGGGKSMTQGRKQGKCFASISLLVEMGPFPLRPIVSSFLVCCKLPTVNPPHLHGIFRPFVALTLPGSAPPHIRIKPHYISHFCKLWGIKTPPSV